MGGVSAVTSKMIGQKEQSWKVIGRELHEDLKCLIRVVLFPDYSSCVE